MGREAKATKDRVCRTCGETFRLTAAELKSHARICEESKRIQDRLDRLGLVNPNDLVIRRVAEL